MINVDLVADSALLPVAEMVMSGTPVPESFILPMLETNDVNGLGMIADFLRKKINSDRAYYSVNMNLNYTNICGLRCPLCAFSKGGGDVGAYTMSPAEAAEKVRAAAEAGADEVHIVGGLNTELGIDYYLELLKAVSSAAPGIHIAAFTAVEYDFIARQSGIPLERVFGLFMEAGLGAVTGGGAEIFDADIRKRIAPKKIPTERWLNVMETAHGMGLRTNATMLYNHIEGDREIAAHLASIRGLQDRTGGFKTFVPLRFHGAGTPFQERFPGGSPVYELKLFAAARIFLHNVPHIKALWMYLGEALAQTLLSFGADDIGGTYSFEKIVHSAGARTPESGSPWRLKQLIETAGFTAVRSNASYETGCPGEASI